MSYVYLHEFPDGKYYVGHCKENPKSRWNKGKGYANQKKVNDAICKYGWDNVKHIVIRVPSEESAKRIEAFLIQQIGTHENGYNTRRERDDDTILELRYYKSLCARYERIIDTITRGKHNI